MNFDDKIYYRFKDGKFSLHIFHHLKDETYRRDIIVSGSKKEVYFNDELEKHEINYAIVSSDNKLSVFDADKNNLYLRATIDALFSGVRKN